MTRSTHLLVLLPVFACGSDPATVPAELDAVEAGAEDTFDLALAGDIAGARASAGVLSDAWLVYLPMARRDEAPEAAITAVDTAVLSLPGVLAGSPDPAAAARAVNAVSLPMARLYDTYAPQVPSVVLDLDYLGREVVLDARVADFARAAAHVDAIA